MKTVVCSICAVVLLAILAIWTFALAEGTTMADIFVIGAALVGKLEDSGQEVVHVDFDIITTDTKSIYRTLQPGWTYTISGFADHRVADLDIIVYKHVGDSWLEITRDQMVDNYPTVSLAPISSSYYRIDVSAYRFQEGYTAAHYGLVIFHALPK